MTRQQIIQAVRSLNPTASEQFLAQFDEQALQEYLQHLEAAKNRVIRIHGWVRKNKMRLAS
jgi:ABC-type transporter MlaC component